jgi:3,4-dihydroxy 2-butanone 4-phosphate synthase
MNQDGSMMRGDDIARFALQHDLTTLTIAELTAWRAQEASHTV